MNQEIEPSEMDEGALKELEYGYMQEAAQRIDTEEPEWRSCVSAAEHKLFGSGKDGGVFHPNLPLAIVAGFSLEQANQKRREANKANQGRIDLNIGDDIVRFEVEYLDLREEDIGNPEPVPAFRVGKGKSLYTDEAVEAPENIDELVAQRMRKGQEEARALLIHRPKGM